MADGSGGDVIVCGKPVCGGGVECDPKVFYCGGANLFGKFVGGGGTAAGGDGVEDETATQVTTTTAATTGASLQEAEDCRKKRCVDRYDSSESSDSGVAVLSCTDCSGSSTASSDITDPGSPFSTASNHSEDSASTKMPPITQHASWPWTNVEECPNAKRSSSVQQQQLEKTAFPKRLKSNEDIVSKPQSQPPPPCLFKKLTEPSPNSKKTKKMEMGKQGKITEYFKSQVKLHLIKKDTAPASKPSKLVDARNKQQQPPPLPSSKPAARKAPHLHHHVTVPRKILPAPPVKFAPAAAAAAVTLTAVSFPPNLAYLHTKTPKPPDQQQPIFVPQFVPAGAAFINCVKLNATVVPIVKLNTLPPTTTLSVETAQPTVISAKVKTTAVVTAPPPPPPLPLVAATNVVNAAAAECPKSVQDFSPDREEKSPSPAESSDSGLSSAKEDGGGGGGGGYGGGRLEVVVEEAAVVPPQKSPILSQPKTIRFPKEEVKEEVSKVPAQENGLCRWAECSAQFDTSGALLEHLQLKHVISQATQEQYVCLWLGCKVHGRTSCSRSWLERHVLAHAGTKPFRCIVDGCGQRFNSQLTLERHVNNHFSGDGTQANNTKKSTESVKLFKRNGKKIRFRRQPWSARMFDFMDAGIMEGLQHRLLTMTQDRTQGQIHDAGNAVNCLSQVLARRVEPDGKVKFLVTWQPVGIIPDEWVYEKEYVRMKSVPIPRLQAPAKETLDCRLFPSKRRKERSRKQQSTTTKQQT